MYDSIHGLSLIQLSEGDYENGLKNYESRFFISNGNIRLRHKKIPRLNTLQNIYQRLIVNDDKKNIIQIARNLVDLGFKICATSSNSFWYNKASIGELIRSSSIYS